MKINSKFVQASIMAPNVKRRGAFGASAGLAGQAPLGVPRGLANRRPHSGMAQKINILRDNLDASRQAAQEQADALRKMRIAFKIAARIMRGDNVPQRDKDFLLEQSPGLFKLAMTARNHDNEDAKDHRKALSQGEERASPFWASGAETATGGAPQTSVTSAPATNTPQIS